MGTDFIGPSCREFFCGHFKNTDIFPDSLQKNIRNGLLAFFKLIVVSIFFLKNDRLLQAIYTDGSECENDRKWQSIIHLYCNRSSQDKAPRLLLTRNCTAEFEWSTEYACRVTSKVSDTCTISDSRTGHVFDFTMLGSKKSFQIENPDSKEMYYMSLCGHADECCTNPADCDAAACKKSDQSQKELMENNYLLLLYL
jgi:hypothetical protein